MDASPGTVGRSTLQSLKNDPSVKDRTVAPGTTRRIIGYVRPYRWRLVAFLAFVALDAAIGAIDPLIYREIINRGILGGDAALVVRLAAVVAVLSLVTAVVLLAQRWASMAIGQGLIYDLRTQVYAHVQRMGLAFFVRTQTGALVSRLDNDVQGAESALTNVLSNAYKYSPGGGPVAVAVELQPGQLQVSVADRGIGIEPYLLERIFDLNLKLVSLARRETQA